jgi:acyl dehydratase
MTDGARARFLEDSEVGEVFFVTLRITTKADFVIRARPGSDWDWLQTDEEIARESESGWRSANRASTLSGALG